MKVQVVGPGCPKCGKLEENTKAAVAEVDPSIEVEKVTNIDEMMELGILASPGLVINGDVQSFGRVLSTDQVESFLRKYTE
ncbi:MAG: thioredoxin family protein [Actinobacteria bacterium]|nr:thioredoxin family protein [Actinomycetota bacterium]